MHVPFVMVAVIVAVPGDLAVMTPAELTVATLVLLELHDVIVPHDVPRVAVPPETIFPTGHPLKVGLVQQLSAVIVASQPAAVTLPSDFHTTVIFPLVAV